MYGYLDYIVNMYC